MKETEGIKQAKKKLHDYILSENLRNPLVTLIFGAIPLFVLWFAAVAVKEGRYKYLVPLIPLFILFTLAFTGALRGQSRAKRILKKLEKDGQLEQAASELDAAANIGDSFEFAALTEHFVIGRNVISLLRYEDIVNVHPVFFNTKNGHSGYLAADTADKKGINAVPLGYGDPESAAKLAIEIITERNPAVTVGEASRR